MTTPARPPGLPFFSRLVLSSPPLVHLVLLHLVHDDLEHAEQHPQPHPRHYSVLSALSLVSKTWSDAARPLLHRFVSLIGRPKQLEQWVYAVEKHEERGGVPLETRAVIVESNHPVKLVDGQEENSDEACDWSLTVLRQAFAKMRGVQRLVLLLIQARALPGDLLAGEGFETVLCPSPPTVSLSSHLSASETAYHIVHGPRRSTSSRRASTRSAPYLESFVASPFETHLFPGLAPCASSLQLLELPRLTLLPLSWRLAVFALLCTFLGHLKIGGPAHAGAIKELLPFFREGSPNLKMLTFDELNLPLGAGILPSSFISQPNPFEALLEVLKPWPGPKQDQNRGLNVLRFGKVVAKGPTSNLFRQGLVELAMEKQISFSIGEVDSVMTASEAHEFTQLFKSHHEKLGKLGLSAADAETWKAKTDKLVEDALQINELEKLLAKSGLKAVPLETLV
ncbi:hypothetical protein JCM8097_006658 [Rhodosporidiobolus ruineniae]